MRVLSVFALKSALMAAVWRMGRAWYFISWFQAANSSSFPPNFYFEVSIPEDTVPLSLLSSYYNSMWVSLHPGCGPVPCSLWQWPLVFHRRCWKCPQLPELSPLTGTFCFPACQWGCSPREHPHKQSSLSTCWLTVWSIFICNDCWLIHTCLGDTWPWPWLGNLLSLF